MQYIEALAQLVAEGWKPKRTVHLSFVPDEEVGGEHGMGLFSKSLVFQNLNVGVAMDEGIPNPESKFSIYYGERRTWWLSIKVTGSPGHGYTIPEQTAASVLHGIVARALYFRNQQFMRIQAGLDIGDAITVNLVYLKSGAPNENSPTGFTMNVIPSVAEAGFDVRVSPKISMEEAEEQISQWLICEDGNQCPGASIKWAQKVTSDVITSRDPKQNPYITAFEAGFASAEIDNRLNHAIFPAATDARFLRDLGIPCFGFSPIEKTPDLLHKHNEFISVDGYLQGVAIYKNVISHLADSHSHEVTHDELPVMESEDASAHTDGKEDL